MFIENEEGFTAACDLILGLLPEVGAVTQGEHGTHYYDGVSFRYKGLQYSFFDFVELIEFVLKVHGKKEKARKKEVKALREQAKLQAKIISKQNRAV